jgi:hypothetical protein
LRRVSIWKREKGPVSKRRGQYDPKITMIDFSSKNLSSAEIRHAIDETKLQLGHLRRSQEELGEFLGSCDVPDPDFELAYEENKCVLVQKRQRLKQLIDFLVETDQAAYAQRKNEFDGLTIELKLDELTADQVQRANDALSRMSLCNESPIEIVRGGVRQTLEEQAILNGEEQPSSGSGGLYL